jgi:tellurite resistance protein TerC
VVVIWLAFLAFILILLAVDLGVFHRRAHVVSVREALTWTVVWIATTLAFAVFVYFGYEQHWLGLGLQPDPVDRSVLHPEGRVNDAWSALLKFLTGYVVELSLSADNVFVMAMLFSYFGIPRMYQHRVLFWGILGALAMRGAMIAIGTQLVAQFAWILPLFGLVLLLTALKMVFMGHDLGDPGQNMIVRLMRRWLPITNQFHAEHFFVRGSAGWMLTPLAPALVMVETTDLVFAVDSIPAIFAITADPFLVFTSNVFAILGLRSLYFALAGALHAFRYLKHALAVVLMTVGIKMLAHTQLEHLLGPNFNLYLLAAVLGILATGVLVSLIELRWREPIVRAAHAIGYRVREWIAPDRLVSTMLRAGRDEARQRALRAADRHRIHYIVKMREPRIKRLWRHLFHGKTRNFSLVILQLMEESGPYATALPGLL